MKIEKVRVIEYPYELQCLIDGLEVSIGSPKPILLEQGIVYLGGPNQMHWRKVLPPVTVYAPYPDEAPVIIRGATTDERLVKIVRGFVNDELPTDENGFVPETFYNMETK